MSALELEIGSTPNYATIWVGDLRFDFSYRTVISFRTPETGRVVRQNDWGPTTGKHLNAIDGGSADAKRRRIPGAEFEAMLTSIVTRIKVI